MSRKTILGRELLTDALMTSPNWTHDRWGNFHYVGSALKGDYKIKFQDISVRLEAKTQSNQWVKIGGAYYKDITIENGIVNLGGRKYAFL